VIILFGLGCTIGLSTTHAQYERNQQTIRQQQQTQQQQQIQQQQRQVLKTLEVTRAAMGTWPRSSGCGDRCWRNSDLSNESLVSRCHAADSAS
jgi:transcription initiation factor TFIID subunit TAF12